MANTNPKMFVNFTGSKKTFIEKGYPTTYANSIVFISGDDKGATVEDKSSCIFAKGKYFANASEAEKYLATLPYFKGIKVGNTTYNAANGGGYLALAANDPATLTINTNSDGVVIGLTDAAKNAISGAAQSATGDGKYISAVQDGTAITVSANVEEDLATSASANKLPTAKSVKDYVISKIDALDVSDTAVVGQYVSAVSEANGKISVFRADLPTLTEGTAEGEVVYGGTAVKVHGLKSAAYTESSAYATSAQGALADSAIQGITAGDYISVTSTGTTKTVAAKVQKISTAATAKQGFADALDVKTELGTLAETISGVNDRAVSALDQLTVWTGKDNKNYSDDETKSIRNISAEEVARIVAGADTNYDTLKEIADWIKSDTTSAAKMAADIETNKTAISNIGKNLGERNAISGTVYTQLTNLRNDVNALGGDAGGIAEQINAALDKLDLDDKEVAGEYVTAVGQVNGQIAVARKALPTYTLATGTTNGTVKFNGAEVEVKGLGSAAYTNSNAYATSAQGTKADESLKTIEVDVESQDYLSVTNNNAARNAELLLSVMGITTSTAKGEGLADAYDVKQTIEAAFTWEELS